MPNLLLIDDDNDLRHVLARGLRRDGHEVLEAPDGKVALRMLGETPIDLVITDIIMPEMEGIELITRLRKQHPGLPVIAMSAGGRLNPATHLQIAQSFGVRKTLSKPFELSALLAAVNELLPPTAMRIEPTA
jgi:DNA-binding response OmpR family regulator